MSYRYLETLYNRWIRNRISSSKIKPKIYFYQVKDLLEGDYYAWVLTIDADEIFEEINNYTVDDTEYIRWTEQQLANNQNCYRESYNTWRFNNYQELEKFQTMFTLKWT